MTVKKSLKQEPQKADEMNSRLKKTSSFLIQFLDFFEWGAAHDFKGMGMALLFWSDMDERTGLTELQFQSN